MAIRTIETVVDIADDRRLVVQLPPDAPTGRHRVVAVLDESVEACPPAANGAGSSTGTPEKWSFPVLEGAKWPPGMILRREDLYDDEP
ncbi:MAG: hypothetical protein ACRCT8_10565 [Lacipirellulaceae bacterium]